LGDVEGQNLTVERYSAEGRPEGYADLAREVVSRNPDVIIAVTDAIARAVGAATGAIPIVWWGAIRSREDWGSRHTRRRSPNQSSGSSPSDPTAVGCRNRVDSGPGLTISMIDRNAKAI
jgi:hypothetical protein